MFGIGTTSFSRENLLGAGEPNRDYNGTDSGNHRLNGTPDYNQRTARRVGGAGNTRGSQRKEGSGMTASDFSISTDSSSPHTGAGGDDINNNTTSDESSRRNDRNKAMSEDVDLTDNRLLSTNAQTKRSLYTLYLTSLMGAIGYSSVMTSAYPYLLSLYPETSTSLYGWVIAMYSIGQLIASPTLGFLSHKMPYRPLFVFTIVLMIIGNVLYAYLSLFPDSFAGYMMLLARFILGFGAGNMTLIRTYASAVTSNEDRAVTMAWVTGTQALGFVIGPVIQTLFTPLDNGVQLHRIRLQFSMYTSPAFLAAIINIANLIIFNINFKEIGKSRVEENESISTTVATSIVRSKNFISVVLCNILWFTFLFDFSFFETIMTPLVQAEYAWTYSKTVLNNGIVLFCNAVMSSLVYLSTGFLTKKFKERHLLAFSTLFLSLAFVFLIPMSQEYPKVAIVNKTTNSNTTSDATSISPSAVGFKSLENSRILNKMDNSILRFDFSSKDNSYSDEIIGCNPEVYEWCSEQHKILFIQFILCACVLSLTYPIGIVTTTSLYSQTIQSTSSQGIYQGILTSAGSLSRALGPVFVSNVFEKHGPIVVFPCITGMTFLIFCLVAIFNKRFGASIT